MIHRIHWDFRPTLTIHLNCKSRNDGHRNEKINPILLNSMAVTAALQSDACWHIGPSWCWSLAGIHSTVAPWNHAIVQLQWLHINNHLTWWTISHMELLQWQCLVLPTVYPQSCVGIWFHSLRHCLKYFPFRCYHTGFNRGLKPSVLDDDVIKWKHFPLYWPFIRGIH